MNGMKLVPESSISSEKNSEKDICVNSALAVAEKRIQQLTFCLFLKY